MNKEIKIILKEMCNRIDVDFDSVDFTQPYWYTNYCWSETKENQFIEWLTEYLKKKEARMELSESNIDTNTKTRRNSIAKSFVYQYGWKKH